MKAKRCQREQKKRNQKPRNSPFFILFAVSFLSFLIIASCGGGGGTTPASTTAKTKDLSIGKKVVEPAKEEVKVSEQKEEIYSYDSIGKPDPFKSFIQLTPLRASSRKTPLTPLERYEVSQLKLVAVISSPEGNVGLVEDSAGKGYFLKKGTLIGKNEGKVKTILKDRVIIEEVFQDVLGQAKTNEISLLLHQPEQEGGGS